MKSIKLISWFLGIAMFAILFSLVMDRNVAIKRFQMIIQLASAAILPMMATAIYVHLQPDVPAEVLPLKIKPPFLPVFFIVLALTNIYLIRRRGPVGSL